MADRTKNSSFPYVIAVMVSLCAVLSALLALVNMFTKPKIEAMEAATRTAAYSEICSGWDIIDSEEMVEYICQLK